MRRANRSPLRVVLALGALAAPALQAQLTTTPGAVEAVRGGRTPQILVRGCADASIGPLSYSFPAAIAGKVRAVPDPNIWTIDPDEQAPSTTSIHFEVDPSAPSGAYVIGLTETVCTDQGQVRLSILSPTVEIRPTPLTVKAGKTSPATALRLRDISGVTATFRLRPASSRGGKFVSVPDPVSVTIPAGMTSGKALLRIATAPETKPGTYRLAFDEQTALGLRSAFLEVIVVAGAPPPPPPITPPVIDRILPGSLAAGTQGTLLHVFGRNFQPGAVLVSAAEGTGSSSLVFGGNLAGVQGGTQLMTSGPTPPISIGPTRVLSSTLVEAEVALRQDAPLGPFRLDLVNPDGGRSNPGGILLIRGPDTLVGAAAVRAAAVIFPSPGSLMGEDEKVYPRGILTTAGTGSIVGTWRLDDQPFDRFVVHAYGGLPVDVRARIPIPQSFLGEHRLELAIEIPQTLVSEPVQVIQVRRRASRPRQLAPVDGRVLSRERRARFRWTLVPGAEGYEIEVLRDLPRLPLTFRTAAPEWVPSVRDLDLIGPGSWRWRVRPLLPGSVRSQATATRTFVILPPHVALVLEPPHHDPATGRERLGWKGGVPGLLYRIELLAEDGQTTLFAALSSQPSYLLPPAERLPTLPEQVRVTALGPGGQVIGASDTMALPPLALVPPSGRVARAASEAAPTVTAVLPADGSTTDAVQPHIEAHWELAVDPSEIALLLDSVDVTAVARVESTSIAYDTLLPLEPGLHVVGLAIGQTGYAWSFTVSASGDAIETARAAQAGLGESGDRLWGNWQVQADGTADGSSGEAQDDTANFRLTVSAQTDIETGTLVARLSGDAAGTQQLTPDEVFREDNRSWVGTFGGHRGDLRQDLTLGYAAPDFLNQTELLAIGLSKGGTELKLSGRRTSAGVYRTFDGTQAGIVTGGFSSQQRIRAAGLELGGTGRFHLRLLGLDVTDPGGAFNPGSDGNVYGLVGSWQIGQGISLAFEGARSDVNPGPGSFLTSGKGNAFRLGLTGTLGTASWGVNLRFTEADFFNPANSGMTPGGVSDRTGADLSFTKGFRRSSLSLGYRYLQNETGVAETQNALTLGYMLRFGDSASFNLDGTYALTDGDADVTAGLPRVDAVDWSLTTTFSETVHGLSLTQTLSRQLSDDDFDPTRYNRTTSASLSAGATPSALFALSGNATWTLTELDPLLGDQDSLTLTLTPILNLQRIGVRIAPYLNYSESSRDLVPGTTRNENYQLSVGWTPRSLGGLVTLELGSGWSRTRAPGFPDEGFVQRYTATVALSRRWLPPPPTSGQADLVGAVPGALPASASAPLPIAAWAPIGLD